jgi:hypothetical protein
VTGHLRLWRQDCVITHTDEGRRAITMLLPWSPSSLIDRPAETEWAISFTCKITATHPIVRARCTLIRFRVSPSTAWVLTGKMFNEIRASYRIKFSHWGSQNYEGMDTLETRQRWTEDCDGEVSWVRRKLTPSLLSPLLKISTRTNSRWF